MIGEAISGAYFAITGVIGQHPEEHWKDVIGSIAWFGFLACVLLLIVLGLPGSSTPPSVAGPPPRHHPVRWWAAPLGVRR